ncbi:MAG: metalloregulator ArsR/SmtB family transcription factor [Actinobacteria bacterium]|nr:metalloregulator ArsR/SmtB family transcription factor [Actinomycetota bacterium]
MKDDKLKKIIKILKALSDESRIRIVNLLKAKEGVCVCEITEVINLSQPTISSHLKKLEEAGIITFRKDGLWVNYYLNDELDSESKELINLIIKIIEKDPEIKKDLLEIINTDRMLICCKK